MRILYIVAEDPISPNSAGGASAMYYDQLCALSDLGHEIHLWHFSSSERRQHFDRFVDEEPQSWQAVKRRCKSVQVFNYRDKEDLTGRILSRLRRLISPRLPIRRWSLLQELHTLIKRLKPDVIWAQHFEPALLAVQQTRVPVVYVHHDWLFRIKALRNRRAVHPQQKKCEERLVRKVTTVVSGSIIECAEIREAGNLRVHYIPVSYEPVALDLSSPPAAKARVVHFGGLGTTANREGLLAFFERVWPHLAKFGLDLKVVGDTAQATPQLKQHLNKVACTGFVKNPSLELRPFDIQIIPWEHPTGQRTRIPLAFNHAQVVVTTRAAAACYPEVEHRKNAVLLETLEDMAPTILELIANRKERIRLGEAARSTFEQNFRREALLPRYAEALSTTKRL